MKLFNDLYRGKKVLVTGNTGFKGSWLSIWLTQLGAEVHGLSNGVPTTPSNFEVSGLRKVISYYEQDVRDFERTSKLLINLRPDFVFHLAAQSLVRPAYKDPLATIETNAIGTANMLEALRLSNHRCTAVFITSDKCYDNVEWVWGYRENDRLGGKDPYSASKACAELIIKTYAESYFNSELSKVRIASARAGNVIGGGDWAHDRIVPDAFRAWTMKKKLEMRSPNATRPWQHVLEPLSGYLLLAQKLAEQKELNGESFNFGPNQNQNFSVQELLEEMRLYYPKASWKVISDKTNFKESGLLKLNCDKAQYLLKWQSTLDFKETIKFVAEWYSDFYQAANRNMLKFTVRQIKEYVNVAVRKNLQWATEN